MAELATIARPYAEALFKAGVAAPEVHALAAVAGDAQLRQLAANPKVGDALVFNVITDVLARQNVSLSEATANFLRTVIANGRVAALPEIAAQLQLLVNERAGVSDATIASAFPLEGDALAQLTAVLEGRFGRKLNPTVALDPSLIGGVRVTVGDEVLDTSVKARLEQMKAALTAA
jgi:F-type H+-transporting ATPase subunit delta